MSEKERVQIEEMVTLKLLDTLKKLPITTDRLKFCTKIVEDYGYEEYSITEAMLSSYGRQLYNMMIRLDKLLRTTKIPILENGV